MLDYHLHLWPHSQSDARTTVEQVTAYCEHAVGGRRHRDRPHRAPLPVHPGQDLLGGFWDDLPRRGTAAGHGRLLGPPRPGRPRRLRRGGPSGQGRGAARSSWAWRSTSTRTGWTRWPTCWPATPSTSCWDRSTGSGTWRFDVLDDPLVMAEWDVRDVDAVWDEYTRAMEELGQSGVCDVFAHPDLVKIAGRVPDGARRVLRPDHRGGRAVGHGRRAVVGGLAEAGRRGVPRTAPPRAVRAGRGAPDHGVGRPLPSPTWPTAPTTCGSLLLAAGVTHLQGYREPPPPPGPRGPRRTAS